jgi:IS30 family transposase
MDTGIEIYFCDPAFALAARHQRQHQWTTAPVLPKGTDRPMHSTENLNWMAAELNERPAKG